MTTLLEIENAVRQFFYDNWSVTEIAWANREYEPSVETAWVALSILPGSSFVDEVGQATSAAGHRGGVVMVRIFTTLNEGVVTAITYGDQVEALFRRKTLAGVYFDEPYTTVVGLDGAWHQINVTCPFWAWNG